MFTEYPLDQAVRKKTNDHNVRGLVFHGDHGQPIMDGYH